MTEPSAQHEPTMEEILASIRKIISEDTADEGPSHQESDVLDLTQEVTDVPTGQPEQAEALSTDGAIEGVQAFEGGQPEELASPASHEGSNVSTNIPDHEGIFSDKARKAIDDAFAGLEHLDEVKEQTTQRTASMPAVEGSTVEAVFERAVRGSVDPVLQQWMDGHQQELLNAIKPLIREWMDEHFPALLEGAVREEVARVVRARGR